ncbi:MAG: hypothetical protein ACK55Z_01015 [bacterium]
MRKTSPIILLFVAPRRQLARTDPRKYSFAVRSIEGWNKLSVNARSAASSESSRKRLKGLKETRTNPERTE